MLDFLTVFDMMPSPKVVATYEMDTNVPEPFCFVLNISELAGADVLEIIPGRVLRRATEKEIEYITDFMRKRFGENFSRGLWETRRPKWGKGSYVKLPKKEWRYFVIEFNGGNEELALLEKALCIAPCGLELGFTLSRVTLGKKVFPACLYSPPRLFQSLSALSYAHSPERGAGQIITVADAEQVGEIFAALKAHDNGVLDLDRIFKLVFELKDLPHFSPLQILGSFAALESILTHAPAPADLHDSITRQIKQKLALLNRRWQPPLDYSSFQPLPHDKIWSKMYDYRSAIAHGGLPDFKSKLSVLKSANSANALISETLKKTICQALKEPQLLADLHEC